MTSDMICSPAEKKKTNDLNFGSFQKQLDELKDKLKYINQCNCSEKTNEYKDLNKDNIIPEIKFIKMSEYAILPSKAHDEEYIGDSGYDLFAAEDTIIPPSYKIKNKSEIEIGNVEVPTHLKLGYITPGWWFRVEAKSGLSFKYGIQPHFGIIDNGYRGELGIKLYNFTSEPFTIKKGQKIAQVIIYRLHPSKVSFTEEVSESSRGDKGFGSTEIIL